MTEKRFIEIISVEKVIDNLTGKEYKCIIDNELLDVLNALHEENELLKNILKDIIIQLDANHTSQTYQMTIPINKVIYNELNRRLTETSFNEELRRFLDD